MSKPTFSFPAFQTQYDAGENKTLEQVRRSLTCLAFASMQTCISHLNSPAFIYLSSCLYKELGLKEDHRQVSSASLLSFCFVRRIDVD